MLEHGIETYFRRAVKAAGGETRKFLGRKNNPDRLVIWPGAGRGIFRPTLVHFVELKRPGGKPRKAQQRELDRLNKMGCTALYLDTKEIIDVYVDAWK